MSTVEQHVYDEPGGRVGLYDRALNDPFAVLLEAKDREVLPPHIPFLKDRGNIHALMPEGGAPSRVAVVANTGSFGFNSPAFYDATLDPHMAAEIEHEKSGFMPIMLAFSRPDDAFVYESPNPDNSNRILGRIAESYQKIGIEVASSYTPVGSINEWVKGARDRTIIPYALDPLIMEAYGKPGKEARRLYEQGLIHAAAYTKTGITQYWERLGIPVPASLYIAPGEHRVRAMDEIRERFANFGEVVVNTSGGAGGFGVYFPEVGSEELKDLLNNFPPSETIQVQGKLPLERTPCLIANIGDTCTEPLQVSTQRFAAPGVHTGNVWQAMDKEALKTSFPKDFWEVNMGALDALQKAGVRGQVNIDSLVISEETAQIYGLTNTTLMREANIRPATSSALIRLREGRIDGAPIRRIHTSAKQRIPLETFLSDEFAMLLDEVSPSGVRVTVTNYDMHDGQTSLAFCSTDSGDEEKLNKAERRLKEQLSVR